MARSHDAFAFELASAVGRGVAEGLRRCGVNLGEEDSVAQVYIYTNCACVHHMLV